VRLLRLLDMSFDELNCRGRQAVSKWLDRTRRSRLSDGTGSLAALIARGDGLETIHDAIGRRDSAAVARLLLDRFQQLSPGRFFDGPYDPQTACLVSEHAPDACRDTIAAAEAACRGGFDLLGYRDLSFGQPVDWALDPISGRRSPPVHWSRLNPLDAASLGDSKLVWELNRHQWLVTLGQAYQLTGAERYAEAAVGHVTDWMRMNPPGIGLGWASSLEVAFRLIAWCWTLALCRRARALSPEVFVQVLAAIAAHAAHVERYLSHYFSPNTHLTGEALGLLYAGTLLPELRRARHWRDLGAHILVEQIGRQVFPDGVYFEQSTCYQRYTAEIYLHFLVLAERNAILVPAIVQDRLARMVDVLLALRAPDGTVPPVGDADGGSLLPLARRAPSDLRGVFSTAGVWLRRSDHAWAAGGVAPETLWMLGPAAVKGLDDLSPAPPSGSPFRVFGDGGYVVMRTGWEPDSHQLIFDVGPLAHPRSGGHGHADLLSIQCAVFGMPCLVDAGTYCYTREPGWRDFFRGTWAHNTVTVDGVNQAVPAGPFGWQSCPRAELRRALSSPTADFADAEHHAYGRLDDPVSHRRRVVLIKPRHWVVVDDLGGSAEHRVDLRFQFAPIIVTLEPTGWVRACLEHGRGLLVHGFATHPLEARIRDGEVAPPQGWVSPDYGVRQPAPVLVYSAVARLPLRVATLLVPVADGDVGPPAVSPMFGENGNLTGLCFVDDGKEIRFDGDDGIVIRAAEGPASAGYGR
jgi:Heparinase II/III-like protein/Heparinase II/III N-terminus